MKKIFTLFVSVFCVTFAANAQLKIQNGNLFFNVPNDYSSNMADYRDYIIWKAKTNLFIGVYPNEGEFRIIPGPLGSTIGPARQGYIDMSDSRGDYHDMYIGNIYTLGSIYNISDARTKINIRPINSAMNTILRLNPVKYQFAEQAVSKSARSVSGADGTETGFIAQEMAEILPNAVTINKNDQYMIDYISLIPILTGAIQELNARVEALERENATLKNR
jgi:hypothetical protein